MSEPILSEG
ncbi:hypothetical protein PENSOL_c075G06453 [Penicillium solitum]|uniref:Uncharacterized protein n=1 Tax=Penicillium solitum TaxID=60172 RepID=A0A1V6QGA0_9EURO|nr:hypothetical protein PENSOL_c075G06453 [Penicillium solitum]